MKEKNISNSRSSNFEILRIIAIIMIIMHHYAIYSGFVWDYQLTINRVLVNIFQMFGKLGVCLFIIISGYFYDKSKFKIKKFVALILQVFIYSIIGLTIGLITNSENLSVINIIKSIFPSTFGLYWFASCYFLIYIFSPFIKKIIENLSKKEFKILLTLMIGIYGILAFIPKTKTFFNEFIWLIVIYFIGAYIKKYNFNFMKNNMNRLKCVILIIIIMNFIMIILELLSTRILMFSNVIYYFNKINSPLVLTLNILIFTILKNMNVKNNKFINKIASTTFGIYLLHENVFLRDIIWKQIIQGSKYINSPLLVLNAIGGVLSVFVIAIIVDLIIEKMFIKNIMKLITKIVKKLKQLKLYIRLEAKLIKFYN